MRQDDGMRHAQVADNGAPRSEQPDMRPAPNAQVDSRRDEVKSPPVAPPVTPATPILSELGKSKLTQMETKERSNSPANPSE